MPHNITPKQAAEWERLGEKATAGPWSRGIVDSIQLNNDGIVSKSSNTVVFCNSGRGSGEPSDDDANFMCAARTALPALLDDRRRVLEMVRRHLANLDSATAMEQLAEWADANTTKETKPCS